MPQQQAKRRGKKKIGTTSSIHHSSTRQGTLYSVPVVLALPETSGSPIQVSKVTQKTGLRADSGDQGSSASTAGDGRGGTRKSARLSLSTTPIVPNKKSRKRIQKLHHQKPASIPSKRFKLSQNESISDESEQYSLVGRVPETDQLETRLDKGDSDVVNLSRLQDEIHNTPNPQSCSMSPQCTKSRKAEITESVDHVTKSKARTNPAVLSSSGKSISPTKLVSEKSCLKTLRTSHDAAQSRRVLRTKQSLLNEKAVDVTEKELPIAECENSADLMGKGSSEPSPTTSRLKTRVKSTDRNATKFSSQIDDAKSSQRFNVTKSTTKAGTSKSSTRSSTRILSAEANNVESATKSAIVETDVTKPSISKSQCTKYTTRSHTTILSAEGDHGKTTTKCDASEEGKTDDTIKSVQTRLSVVENTAATDTVDLTVAEKNSVKFASLKTDSVQSTERSGITKFSSRSKSRKSSTAESDVKHITRAVTAKSSQTETGISVENAAEICTKADGVKSTPEEVDTSKSLVEESDINGGTRGFQAKSVNTAGVKTRESDLNSIGTEVHLKSASKNTIAERSIAGSFTTKGSSTLETVNTEAGLTKSGVTKSVVTETDEESSTGSRTETVESLRVTSGRTDSVAGSEMMKCTPTEASCTKSTERTGTAKSSTVYPNFTIHVGPKNDADTMTVSRTDILEADIEKSKAKAVVAKYFSTDSDTIMVRKADTMETTIKSDSVTVPENNGNVIKTTDIETEIAKSNKGETETLILIPKADIEKSFLVIGTERHTSLKSEMEKFPTQSLNDIVTSPVKQAEITKSTSPRAGAKKSTTSVETIEVSREKTEFTKHPAAIYSFIKTDDTEADAGKSVTAKSGSTKWFSAEADVTKATPTRTDAQSSVKADISKILKGKDVRYPQIRVDTAIPAIVDTKTTKSSIAETETGNPTSTAVVVKPLLVLDDIRCSSSGTDFAKATPPKTVRETTTSTDLTKATTETDITNLPHARVKTAKSSSVNIKTNKSSATETEAAKPTTEAEVIKSLTVVDPTRLRSQVELVKSTTILRDEIAKLPVKKYCTEKSSVFTKSTLAERDTENFAMKVVGTAESSAIEMDNIKPTKPKFETTNLAKTKLEITEAETVKPIVATADIGKCIDTDNFKKMGKMKTTVGTDSIKSQTSADVTKSTTVETKAAQSGKVETETIKLNRRADTEKKKFLVVNTGRHTRSKSKFEKSSTVCNYDIIKSSAEQTKDTESPSTKADVEKPTTHSETSKLFRVQPVTPETAIYSMSSKTNNAKADAGKSTTAKSRNIKSSSPEADLAKAIQTRTDAESTGKADKGKATTATSKVKSPQIRLDTVKTLIVDTTAIKSSAVDTKATKSITRTEVADFFSEGDGAKPNSKAEMKSATVADDDFVKSPVEEAYDVKSSSSKVIIAKSTPGETETGRSVMKRVGTPNSCTEETLLTKPTMLEATNSVETKTDITATCFTESITKSSTARSTGEEIGFLKSSTAIVDITNSKTIDSNSGHNVSATTDSSVTSTEELDLSESAAFVSHIADAMTVSIVAQCTEQEAGSVECTLTRTEFVRSTPNDAKSVLIDIGLKDIKLGTDAKMSSITEPESTVLNSGQDVLKSSEARAETADCTVTEADTTKSSSTKADTVELFTTVQNTDDFIIRSNIAESTTAAVDSAHSTTVKNDIEKLTKMNSHVKVDTLSFFINKSDIEKSNVAKDIASESFKKPSAAKSPRVASSLISMTGVGTEKSFFLEKDDLKILSISDVEKSSTTAEVDIAITPRKTGVQSSSSEGEIAKVDVKNNPITNANTSKLVSCIARDNTDVKFPGSNTEITPVSVTNVGETVVTTAKDEMTSVTIADIEMSSITTSSTGCTSVAEFVAGISTANNEDTVVSPSILGMTSNITTNTNIMPTTTANTGMIIMPTDNAKLAEVIAADSTLRTVTITSTGMTSVMTAHDKILSLKTSSAGMKSFDTSGIGETPTTQLSTGEIIYTTASTGERAVTTASIRETMVTTANGNRGVTIASNGKTSATTPSTRKLAATTVRNRNDIVSTAVTGKAKTKRESSENIQVTTAGSEKFAKAGDSLKTTAITTAKTGKTKVTTGSTRKTVSTTASTRETLATMGSIIKTVASTASTVRTVATTECTAKTAVITGNTGKTKVSTANSGKTKVPSANTWKRTDTTASAKTTVTTASARKTTVTTARTGKTGGPIVKSDNTNSLQFKTANSKQELITPVDTGSSANASAITTTSTVDPLPKTGNAQFTVAKSCSKVKSPIKAPVVAKSKSVEASTGKSVYSGIEKNIISKVNPAPVASLASGVVPDSSSTSSTKVDTALTNQKILNQLEEKSDHGNLNERSVDEPLFDHVVIFANALYKHHLEKLSCYQVTVITEDNLTFKDVPEVISRSWNKRTKKALWLLPLGIYSHVEFHPNYDCERYRCLCPLTSISYEGNTEPSKKDMVYRISDMISQAKLLRESVQQELGPKSLVMLVPLIPAAIVQEDAFQDHHSLHSAISKNFTYSSNSTVLCVLHTIYNTLCDYWSSVVSEPMENYLSSVMVKFMNMNQGKNFTYIQSDSSYSYVFKPWLNMMKSVIALALTYSPKGTSGHHRNVEDLIPSYTVPSTSAVPVNHTQQIIGSSFKQINKNQARPLFQQIVVLGNRDFPTELKELSRHFPIHYEHKNISFDDIGMNTILKYQKKWQYQTLWFIVSDFSNVITPADYGPKCAMLQCQEPLKVFSLQTCNDYPRCTSNILKNKADNAVHFVKDFASSLTEHLEENSAVFLAPVSPSYVMWEDPSSLHSHEYLHKVVKASPDIPVVIGQKEDWEEFSIQLKSKWITMLKRSMSGHIEPMKVMNMYLKSESKILEFVSPVPRARVSFTQDAWNDVIRGLLMYFANAKIEDWGAEESLYQNDSDSASEELSAVSVTSGEQLNKDIVVSQPQKMQVGVSSTEDPSDTLHKLSVSSVKSQTQLSLKQRENLPATPLALSPIKWPGGPADPVAKPPDEPSDTLPAGLQVRLQIEPPIKLSAKSNKQQLEPSKLPVEPPAKQPSVQLIKEERNLQTKLPTELPVEPHAKQPGVHLTKQETDFLTKLPTGALVKQSTEVPPLKLQEVSAKLQIEPSSNLPAKPAKLSVNPSNKELELINNRGKAIDHTCAKSKCFGIDSNKNGNGVSNSEKEIKDNYNSSSCEKDRVDKSISELRLTERAESRCDSSRAVSLKMFSSEKGNSHQEDLRKKIQRCDSPKLDGRNEDACTVFGEQDHHPKKYFLVRASNIDMLPLSVIHEVFLACGAVGNGKFDGEDLLFAFKSVKGASVCVAKLNNIQILDRFLKVKLEDDSYGNAVEKHADGIPKKPKNCSQSSEGSKKMKSHHSHRKQYSLLSALPTSERQPPSKRKSHKQRRSSSSSSSSSATSSFSPLFLEKSPKQRRSSSPDSSSSGFSASSSAERICHNYDRDTKKLFLVEEQRLKMELQVDYQTYSEIPEVHPRHEECYRAFRAKYYDIYADEGMKECKRLWLSVWEELMNAEHKEEWERKRTRLVQQFEAIAAEKKQGDNAKRKKRKREKYEDGKHNYVVSADPTPGGSWESTEEIIRNQKATSKGKGEFVSDSTVGNFLFGQATSELEEKHMDDIKVPMALTTNLPKDKNQSYLEGRGYVSLLTSKNVPVIGDYLPVASTSQHKGDANYVASDKVPTLRESLSHTLALLLELCESLDVLGPAIKVIVQKVLNCGTNTRSALKVLDDDNNALLMKMASEKLISLSEKAKGNYKDMLLRGSIQAAKLLEYAAASSQNEKKTYSGIDVEKIAKATMNQDASCIVKFIKSILAYEGVGNPTFEDINDIFLAVSSRHFHMALQS